MRRRILTVLLPLAIGLSLCACESKEDKIQEEGDQQEALMEAETEGEEAKDETAKKAGGTVVILLAGTKQREADVSAALLQAFEKEGYAVRLEFAQGEAKAQEEQLEKLAQEEIRGLVLEPVDPDGLDAKLAAVSDTGAFVVSYGSLVMNTEHVDAYVTFDYYSQGQEMGEWLEEQAGLKDRDHDDPAHVELLAQDTINDKVAYLGLMEVLAPYYEEGTLTTPSGKTNFEDIVLESGETAYDRCESILSDFYSEERLDAICATSDLLAGDVCRALEKASYKPPSKEDKAVSEKQLWPMVGGAALDANGKNRIATGRQAVSFYGSHEELSNICAEVLHGLVSGEELDDASTEYDNGVKIVNAYLSGMEIVDEENLKDYR